MSTHKGRQGISSPPSRSSLRVARTTPTLTETAPTLVPRLQLPLRADGSIDERQRKPNRSLPSEPSYLTSHDPDPFPTKPRLETIESGREGNFGDRPGKGQGATDINSSLTARLVDLDSSRGAIFTFAPSTGAVTVSIPHSSQRNTKHSSNQGEGGDDDEGRVKADGTEGDVFVLRPGTVKGHAPPHSNSKHHHGIETAAMFSSTAPTAIPRSMAEIGTETATVEDEWIDEKAAPFREKHRLPRERPQTAVPALSAQANGNQSTNEKRFQGPASTLIRPGSAVYQGMKRTGVSPSVSPNKHQLQSGYGGYEGARASSAPRIKLVGERPSWHPSRSALSGNHRGKGKASNTLNLYDDGGDNSHDHLVREEKGIYEGGRRRNVESFDEDGDEDGDDWGSNANDVVERASTILSQLLAAEREGANPLETETDMVEVEDGDDVFGLTRDPYQDRYDKKAIQRRHYNQHPDQQLPQRHRPASSHPHLYPSRMSMNKDTLHQVATMNHKTDDHGEIHEQGSHEQDDAAEKGEGQSDSTIDTSTKSSNRYRPSLDDPADVGAKVAMNEFTYPLPNQIKPDKRDNESYKDGDDDGGDNDDEQANEGQGQQSQGLAKGQQERTRSPQRRSPRTMVLIPVNFNPNHPLSHRLKQPGSNSRPSSSSSSSSSSSIGQGMYPHTHPPYLTSSTAHDPDRTGPTLPQPTSTTTSSTLSTASTFSTASLSANVNSALRHKVTELRAIVHLLSRRAVAASMSRARVERTLEDLTAFLRVVQHRIFEAARRIQLRDSVEGVQEWKEADVAASAYNKSVKETMSGRMTKKGEGGDDDGDGVEGMGDRNEDERTKAKRWLRARTGNGGSGQTGVESYDVNGDGEAEIMMARAIQMRQELRRERKRHTRQDGPGYNLSTGSGGVGGEHGKFGLNGGAKGRRGGVAVSVTGVLELDLALDTEFNDLRIILPGVERYVRYGELLVEKLRTLEMEMRSTETAVERNLRLDRMCLDMAWSAVARPEEVVKITGTSRKQQTSIQTKRSHRTQQIDQSNQSASEQVAKGENRLEKIDDNDHDNDVAQDHDVLPAPTETAHVAASTILTNIASHRDGQTNSLDGGQETTELKPAIDISSTALRRLFVLDTRIHRRVTAFATHASTLIEKEDARVRLLDRKSRIYLRRALANAKREHDEIEQEVTSNISRLPLLKRRMTSLRATLAAQMKPLALCAKRYELRASRLALAGEGVDEVSVKLENELAVLQGRVDAIEADLSLIQSDIAGVLALDEQLRLHLRAAEMKLKMYARFLAKKADTHKTTTPSAESGLYLVDEHDLTGYNDTTGTTTSSSSFSSSTNPPHGKSATSTSTSMALPSSSSASTPSFSSTISSLQRPPTMTSVSTNQRMIRPRSSPSGSPSTATVVSRTAGQ